MGGETSDRRALRLEIEAAVLDAVAKVGPDGLDKSAIVSRFAGRAPQSTLYRMIDAPLKSGKAGRMVEKVVAEAVAARASADPARDAARDAVEILPKPIRVDAVVASKGGQSFGHYIQRCIDIAEKLIQHACTTEGNVRNAKLLAVGSESLRRSMETALKIQVQMRDLQQVDEIHNAMMEEIARESPECAERIFMRVGHLLNSMTLG